MLRSGIYRIDGPTKKFYIGSAKHIARRWIEHRRDLRANKHANPKLQCAWNAHGEAAFAFSVLELVEQRQDLIAREQVWIDQTQAAELGYNILPIAGSHLGRKASDETRKKQSLAHTGRKHGPMSQEQKDLYSALYKGKKLSEETKKKMSESRKGRVFSEETRRKISESHKGKCKSTEHREALRQANLGKKHSPDTIAKMRAAHAARNATI